MIKLKKKPRKIKNLILTDRIKKNSKDKKKWAKIFLY